MPKSALTLPDIQNAQLGISLALAYGYNRVRGNEIINHQLANKNRVIFRILGEGEWDGIERLWINSKLVNTGNPNIVVNGDGETGTLGSQATGWTFDSGNNLVVANDFVHSGAGSLKINNAAAADSFSHEDYSVSDGDVYQLQGWIKTTAIPSSPGHGAVLNIATISGIAGYSVISKNGSDFQSNEPDVGIFADGNAHDWTQVSAVFRVIGSGTMRLYLQLGFGGSVAGTAWFDDVMLYKISSTLVHFHPGADGTLGGGLNAVSNGGDQLVDSLFLQLPAAFQKVTFSRKAYLALNIPPDPGAPDANVDILGDFRCLKVRQFDNTGAQTAYSFSTNGAWQILDLLLRSYLRPEWLTSGANAAGGDLAAAEKARIDFASVADAASKCDTVLADGNKRFESNVAFSQTTSLADALTQLQNISQIFVHEVAGKIYIRADQLRASSFILTTDHVVPGTFSLDKTDLHGAKNRLIAAFRDVNPADTADIDTVANSGLVRSANVVTVKTKLAHPYLVGDSVVICPPLDGSTHDTSFDGMFTVASVPSSTTFTYAQSGANATSGNGFTGTPESRFAQRIDKVDHQQHQQAIGQRGLGLTQAFRVVPVTIDLGNNIFSRVRRIINFIVYRYLGLDQAPYNAPFACKVTAFMNAVDANNHALIAQLGGDILTIDATISEEFQGDYEIQKMTYNIPALGSGSSSSSDSQAAGNAPTIELTLLQYVTGAYSDGIFLAQTLPATVPRVGLAPAMSVDPNGIQRLLGSFTNNPVNTQGAFTGSNPLSQSGTSTTINIASSTQQFGDGQVSYNSGSVNPGTYQTSYVTTRDPWYLGGAVVYQPTATKSQQVASNDLVGFGQITTAAGGGGTGAGGGGGACFCGNTRVRVSNRREGFTCLRFKDLTANIINIETEAGRLQAIVHSARYAGWMHDMGDGELVTPEHRIKVTQHFYDAAKNIWRDRVWYEGEVYTLETLTDLDAERYFILGNGRIAHNFSSF